NSFLEYLFIPQAQPDVSHSDWCGAGRQRAASHRHIKNTISVLRQRSRILWGNLWHGFLPESLEKLQYMPQPHRNRKTGNQPKWKNLYLLYSCIDSFLEENSQKIVHNVYY
ncbi:MAG: hypothetical protein ACI3XW_10220, partial [Butyricicoccus sp.]